MTIQKTYCHGSEIEDLYVWWFETKVIVMYLIKAFFFIIQLLKQSICPVYMNSVSTNFRMELIEPSAREVLIFWTLVEREERGDE